MYKTKYNNITNHTEGPWRWELSVKDRNVQLCGGIPKYDLTVFDFVRKGMQSATIRFRQLLKYTNIMENCDAYVNKAIISKGISTRFEHPDAILIEQAPAMLIILRMCQLGLSRIEGNEFCFRGIRYSISDYNYNSVIEQIGWDICRDAIKANEIKDSH